MRPRDIGLAVTVMAIWGFNFVAIDVGLHRMPPLLFSALRFALAAFPALLFVGLPQARWRWVLAVGFMLGVVKFSLLFGGIAAGMPPGLTSLVLQSAATFTLVFSFALLRERPTARQWKGTAVATLGIVVVAANLGAAGPLGAFLLVVAAGAAWGLSNLAIRKAAPPSMLNFMVWVSAVATLPLLVLSLAFEGLPRPNLDAAGVAALLYTSLISTLAGFAIWGTLIRRYTATTVAPFSMLVPFFGMASAALFLGEPLHPVIGFAALLVIGGVLYSARRPRLTPGARLAEQEVPPGGSGAPIGMKTVAFVSLSPAAAEPEVPPGGSPGRAGGAAGEFSWRERETAPTHEPEPPFAAQRHRAA